ncbi:hypothetical protein E0L36_23465 [Streptomyces sp. AJS327]|uniref:hypothetical protein n=1 Tax=Streptomyces sp. AJS327 TaxID=2545265 RepID=UPI0015E02A15|nr:hypothetical protein [Streptomyces sp. AJS327]MBA0053713.1 hypothetical protein [Streptomyces sp. AJS327]
MTRAQRYGQVAVRPVVEAEEVREELREALAEVGVKLPTLRLEPISVRGWNPRPVVDLGRCNLVVARELTAVLRKCADQGRER